jgi:signal transduction histidine kinase
LQNINKASDSLVKYLPVLKRSTKLIKPTTPFQPYAELIKPLCETHRQKARSKGIGIDIKGTDQLPSIYAVINDFEHIVQNLIDNAIKYSMRGSEILVKMQRIDKETNCAMIHVLSESLPIDEDEVEEIFKAGYRSKATLKEGIEGDGVGLPFSRALARRFGGNIILTQSGKYNIFSLLIPKVLFK